MSQRQVDGTEVLHDLQDLVEELGAWLRWTQLGGAEVIPADGPMSRVDRQNLVQALSTGLGRGGSAGTSSSPPAAGRRFSASGVSGAEARKG